MTKMYENAGSPGAENAGVNMGPGVQMGPGVKVGPQVEEVD